MQIHILSFEGPDPYAQAGGIATRITGLAQALANFGHDVHIWFVGDPNRPGHERIGNVVLHRWCQWISRMHLAGVYDGEEGKVADYQESLPPYLINEVLEPYINDGGHAVVLAEEWHTAKTVLRLDELLIQKGLRQSVNILWNANNTFGFHRIPWKQLDAACTITTVSRYMKHLMWPLGIDPLAIPNGLGDEAFLEADRPAVAEIRRRFKNRTLLAKVARWDPDKRWLLAVDTISLLRKEGRRPLFVARGGLEAHGGEVLAYAVQTGLRVEDRRSELPGPEGLLQCLKNCDDVDVVNIKMPIDAQARLVLLRAANAVLVNSGHEPFGLVGLETMAAGGIACTGCSGEDYAIGGVNALVLQTQDPREFLGLYKQLLDNPKEETAMRRAGRLTARRYSWAEVIQHALLPRLNLLRNSP